MLFTQFEFEFEMYKHLGRGDEACMATSMGQSPSIVSQYLNPNDDRAGVEFRAAQSLVARIEADCTRGQRALQTFLSFVHRALPCDSTIDLEEARRDDHREGMEFTLAEIETDDIDKQIKEGEEAVAATQRHVDALRAERARRQQRAAFPGQSVSHSARAIGKRVISNGR